MCYFFGEDLGILIVPDENRDQILSYFANEDEIEKINTDFEEFVKDESVAFSDYVIGIHHVSSSEMRIRNHISRLLFHNHL